MWKDVTPKPRSNHGAIWCTLSGTVIMSTCTVDTQDGAAPYLIHVSNSLQILLVDGGAGEGASLQQWHTDAVTPDMKIHISEIGGEWTQRHSGLTRADTESSSGRNTR